MEGQLGLSELSVLSWVTAVEGCSTVDLIPMKFLLPNMVYKKNVPPKKTFDPFCLISLFLFENVSQ